MHQDHQRFMRLAMEEARKAGQAGNRAVGAVVVFQGRVVGRGGNCREATGDPTGHAELMALRDAARNLGRYDMTGCTLYTTLEPCPMCGGAVIANDVGALVVGGRHPSGEDRWGGYTVEKLLAMSGRDNKVQRAVDVLAEECTALLREWDIKQGRVRA